MEIKCLQCAAPVPQTPGKRKKEYCGATCRTTFWKKKKHNGVPKRGPGRPKKYLPPKPVPPQKTQKSEDSKKEPPKAATPPKEMPPGLSKVDMLKWHKSNRNK